MLGGHGKSLIRIPLEHQEPEQYQIPGIRRAGRASQDGCQSWTRSGEAVGVGCFARYHFTNFHVLPRGAGTEETEYRGRIPGKPRAAVNPAELLDSAPIHPQARRGELACPFLVDLERNPAAKLQDQL